MYICVSIYVYACMAYIKPIWLVWIVIFHTLVIKYLISKEKCNLVFSLEKPWTSSIFGFFSNHFRTASTTIITVGRKYTVHNVPVSVSQYAYDTVRRSFCNLYNITSVHSLSIIDSTLFNYILMCHPHGKFDHTENMWSFLFLKRHLIK